MPKVRGVLVHSMQRDSACVGLVPSQKDRLRRQRGDNENSACELSEKMPHAGAPVVRVRRLDSEVECSYVICGFCLDLNTVISASSARAFIPRHRAS